MTAADMPLPEPAYPECYEIPRTGGATRDGWSIDQMLTHREEYAAARVAEVAGPLVDTLATISAWCCFATEEDINARLLALQQIGVAARDAMAKHKESTK